MGRKLFVGNLAYSVDNATLGEAFGAFGELISASVVMDRETQRSRGFGFVEFTTEDAARAALQALEGSSLNGRNISVREAEERRRPPMGEARSRPMEMRAPRRPYEGGGGGGYGGPPGGGGGGNYGGGGGGGNYGGGGGNYGGGGGNYGGGGGGGGGGGNYGGGGGNYGGGGGGGGNYGGGPGGPGPGPGAPPAGAPEESGRGGGRGRDRERRHRDDWDDE